MKVKDYMTKSPVFIEVGSNVKEAKELIEKHKFRHLPVVKGENIVGIVSNRDLERTEAVREVICEYIGEETVKDLKVEDIMIKEVQTISPNALLKRAAQIMAEKKYGCLPVIDRKKLVGIISAIDILKAFIKMVK